MSGSNSHRLAFLVRLREKKQLHSWQCQVLGPPISRKLSGRSENQKCQLTEPYVPCSQWQYSPYFIFGVFLFGAGQFFKIHPAEFFISHFFFRRGIFWENALPNFKFRNCLFRRDTVLRKYRAEFSFPTGTFPNYVLPNCYFRNSLFRTGTFPKFAPIEF